MESKKSHKFQETFLSKSRAAVLQQRKLHMEKQNKSFIRIDEKELTKSLTVEVITLTSDSTQSSPLKIYTSEAKFDFMVTSPNSPGLP